MFGIGANSGSSGSGFGVDIGLRDRGMIGVFLPDSPGCSCNRWPGLFGVGPKPNNCSGSEDLRMDLGISLKKGGLRILRTEAAPVTRTIVRAIRSAPDLRIRSKKNKKRCFLLLTRVAMFAIKDRKTTAAGGSLRWLNRIHRGSQLTHGGLGAHRK